MLKFRLQLLKRRLQADPFYRFQSSEEVAIAGELGVKIEVNQATVDEWLRLPGLSIHQARQLVELTGLGMQFLCLEDLAAALNVPVQQLRFWNPVLSFTYADPESLLTPAKIAVNQADLDQLLTIPFMSPAIAENLIKNRDQAGPYRNLADLQKRLKLPLELISQLLHYLQF
ncbi:MAG: ComEA family DNA-binding protein [Synechocystis sp.]|nr:ComEA family DNA-binding protein [Synechocystis sp.]